MRKVRELILRFGGLFDRQRKERDFAQELEGHIQMHIEDNLRLGLSPEEARRPGGSRSAIIRLFLKQGSRVLAIGLALGLCGAVGAAKILRSQVYGVQPVDLATFAIACALMSAAGLFAVWWPARRAARIDPMVALRSE